MDDSIIQAYKELRYKKDNIKQSFRSLDRDHDECLSKEEFRLLLRNNDIFLSDQTFDLFFSLNARKDKVSYSNLYSMVNLNLRDESFVDSNTSFLGPEEDKRTMLRLGEIETRSNPYMNPYNHSRPQNISRIDQSFTDDYQPFTTTVFRTGHYSRASQQKEDAQSELSSITRDLLNYDFRPNVDFVHKNILISSPIPFGDDVIRGIVSNMQQELSQTAVLRHFTIYRVTDTSTDNKCVLSFIWCLRPSNQGVSQMVERSFGKEVWKHLCTKYFTNVQIHCETMIDIHPNYCEDKFCVY